MIRFLKCLFMVIREYRKATKKHPDGVNCLFVSGDDGKTEKKELCGRLNTVRDVNDLYENAGLTPVDLVLYEEMLEALEGVYDKEFDIAIVELCQVIVVSVRSILYLMKEKLRSIKITESGSVIEE